LVAPYFYWRPHTFSSNTPSTCPICSLLPNSLTVCRHLKASAATIYPDFAEAGETLQVHTTSMTVEAMLPWMEVATSTDTSSFDRVPDTIYSEWLRAVVRHSCLYEERRVRTVKGVSWWPIEGASGLGASGKCDAKCQDGSMHREMFYLEGVHEVCPMDQGRRERIPSPNLCGTGNPTMICREGR
jgi:hypothetical protein